MNAETIRTRQLTIHVTSPTTPTMKQDVLGLRCAAEVKTLFLGHFSVARNFLAG
jgi:hypothetical protein